jgi:hypothetical protein
MSTVAAETTAPKAQAAGPGFARVTTRHVATATAIAVWRTLHRDVLGSLRIVVEWAFFVAVPRTLSGAEPMRSS